MEVLADQGQQKFRTAGITHLLEHPEYHSLDKAKPLMAYLSEEGDPPRLPAPLDTGKQGPFQIVVDGEESLNRVRLGVSPQRFFLLGGALAVVVVFGGQAEELLGWPWFRSPIRSAEPP
mgnify:CR=1 FL=1